MKKLFALLLALMLVFSLAACGGGDDKPSSAPKPSSSSQQQTQTSKPDESKPAESQQSTDGQPSGEEKSPAEKAEETAAGFGSYNGQPIVWRVLDIDDENEKALLVTKDIVALMAFAEGTETWEDSLVRQWLNNDFINEAFTDEEAAIILSTDITIAPNAEYGTSGGNSTTDKVFLLSEAEVNSYFIDGEARRSNYNGELEDWWTITSGEDETSILIVMGEGTILTDGYSKQQEEGVRPAIWVNLSDEQAAPGEDTQGGSTDNSQQTSSGEASLDNVTDSNYAALAKELFGIDVDPEGDWELVKAESTGTIGGGMGIVYQGSATVDSKELMKAYYDATADISTAGICIGQADSISEPFADFEAFFEEGTKARGSVGEWIYEYGGKKIELMFALSPEMELTITIDFLADNKYS